MKANRISICIIDDCGDSDVPLLELSFSDVQLYQLLPELNINDPVHPQGFVHCILASDYYNRVLSGWEPVLEPWRLYNVFIDIALLITLCCRCKILWEKIISQMLLKNRLSLKVESDETFNINITSTLIDLYKQVKDNWIKDYYNVKLSNGTDGKHPQNTMDTYRQRSPFIPFALKNDTGSLLKFTTHIADVSNVNKRVVYKSYENWIQVNPGETVPFSFTTRGIGIMKFWLLIIYENVCCRQNETPRLT